MMMKQLDLVDFIAGLRAAPVADPLSLLPRRPKEWERNVFHIPASEVRIMAPFMWTGVVVEQLRDGRRADLLLHDGRIDRRDMERDSFWSGRSRVVILPLPEIRRIHDQWMLTPVICPDNPYTFRFADHSGADRAPTSRLLRKLEEEQS
ncbi:hypothetical protein [Komagataeibacter saccharivorans]|uniref:hypothetical protein n=1 Tax=Komagataeibacter saccharivorans TaxID=265959 RepID=UPI0039E79DC0